MYLLERNDDEIDAVLDAAMEGVNGGSKWPGMSYEQGVEAALLWVTGQNDENPMVDE